MTAMVEALSFLGPCGPVARDANLCMYYDSKHAAGVCLGFRSVHMFNWHLHVSGRRNAPNTGYGLPCNTCVRNECADHAATLGTFGLISNHNVATRWTRHNFDASVCFDGCNNISEILER